jgi:hypothetical protein
MILLVSARFSVAITTKEMFCFFPSMTAPKIPPSALKIGESDYVVSGRLFSLYCVSSLALQPLDLQLISSSTFNHVNILDNFCRNLAVNELLTQLVLSLPCMLMRLTIFETSYMFLIPSLYCS